MSRSTSAYRNIHSDSPIQVPFDSPILLDQRESQTKGILHSGDGEEYPVEGFRSSHQQTITFWIMSIFSLGIVYMVYCILEVWNPYYAATLRYKSVALDEAELIIVHDIETDTNRACHIHLVNLHCAGYGSTARSHDSLASVVSTDQTPNFNSSLQQNVSGGTDQESKASDIKMAMKRKKSLKLPFSETGPLLCSESSEIKYITFRYCRYIYSKPFNSFYYLSGLDGDNPMRRPKVSLDGLKSDDVRILQEIYGANELKIYPHSYLEIFLDNIVDSFYIFQIFTIIVWMWAGYYYYVLGMVLWGSVIILIALRLIRRKTEQLSKESAFEVSVTVVRDGYQYSISHKELVPGDIVVLNKSANYITFDGIFVKSSGYVDKALMNGVTLPYYRTTLGADINARINKLSTDSQNTIFSGTYLLETITDSKEDDALALVVNTGFMTDKGWVMREVTAPDTYRYSTDKDTVSYFRFLIVLGAIAFGVALAVLWISIDPMDDEEAILAALRLVTLAIPPSLPLALTVAFIWATMRLARDNISIMNVRRIYTSGKVHCIVFDKTGTLTKNITSFIGHLTTYTENEEPQLGDLCTGKDNLPVGGDVLYLLASCHGLTPGGKNHSLLDKCMFASTGWDFGPSKSGLTRVYSGNESDLGEYKVDIIRRFSFQSEKLYCGVVVRVCHEDRDMCYIKGSPDTVFKACKPSSIPETVYENLRALTRHGYVVLGMAAKQVPDGEKVTRVEEMEWGMNFLGLLVFGDELADGATEVVSQLQEAQFSTIMCTGDTLNTAVSVARKVGILPPPGGIRDSHKVIVFKAWLDDGGGLDVYAYDFDDETVYNIASAWGESWDPPNYVLEGETWQLLNDMGGSELDRILIAGKVFAAMKPIQKKDFVQLKRKIGHETCMVGDGQNDNEAIVAADVGISLNRKESGFSAPFNSTDIRCVPILLNEGRTALAQLLTIFMFTACYSVLAMFAEILMYAMYYELSQAEWIYIDLILVMSIDLMLGYSESRDCIKTSRKTDYFWNTLRLFSMFCFLVVCVLFQLALIWYLEEQEWYREVLVSDETLTGGSMEATYIFLLLIFQLTYPAIVYTMEREPIYKNTYVFLLFVLLYSINTYLDLFPMDWTVELFEFFVSPSVLFRGEVLIAAFINLILNIVLEIGFICFKNRKNKRI